MLLTTWHEGRYHIAHVENTSPTSHRCFVLRSVGYGPDSPPDTRQEFATVEELVVAMVALSDDWGPGASPGITLFTSGDWAMYQATRFLWERHAPYIHVTDCTSGERREYRAATPEARSAAEAMAAGQLSLWNLAPGDDDDPLDVDDWPDEMSDAELFDLVEGY